MDVTSGFCLGVKSGISMVVAVLVDLRRPCPCLKHAVRFSVS